MQAKDDPSTVEEDAPRARGANAPHTRGANAPTGPPRDGGEPAVGVARDNDSTRVERRPLLMVDIDGVISLFGGDAVHPGRAESATGPGGSFHSIDGIPHFLSSTAAENLLALAASFELVWASGWEEKANEYLPHLLGLPELAHLSFERSVGRTNAHWKLDAIEAHAGDRPLAWIDDAFNDACREWAHAREVPTLLVQTAPASGLTSLEAGILERWARELVPGWAR